MRKLLEDGHVGVLPVDRHLVLLLGGCGFDRLIVDVDQGGLVWAIDVGEDGGGC